MDEIQILQKRLEELAKQSYQSGIFTFSDFLSLAEQDVFYRMERELSYSKPSLFGGAEPCERKIVRFGSEDELGYSLDYPIKCIKASAKDPKFSDGFSHRDLLGALMNLGIKRQMLGDIAVDGTDGFIFCHEKICDFILMELKKARHTVLSLSLYEGELSDRIFKKEPRQIQCASLRLDCVVAKAWELSRSEAQELIESGKVFIGGMQCLDNSYELKEEQVVSVRGHGKFVYKSVLSLSKKGKLNLLIEQYV